MTRVYSADDVARYFLAKVREDEGDLISNLKLQKLCYYAQGVGLAARRHPMFVEPIEAWLHGPVVPALYQKYRIYGAGQIPAVTDLTLDDYASADRMILDDVYDFYGQYSAWRLREMTHKETPWVEAYVEGASNQISHEALRSFFTGEIDDDYILRYEAAREKGEKGGIRQA